jgi:hypothetical protein
MELRQLENEIRTLATLEEAASPLISCYLDLSAGLNGCWTEMDARFQVLKKSQPIRFAADLDEATSRIKEYPTSAIAARTRGLAAFSRGGASPYWLPLQFEVPMPTWIAAGSTPNIYHLAV